MANILFLIGPLARKSYSGGSWCILRHAEGLAKRGHRVAVLPVLPCRTPDWWEPAVPFLHPSAFRSGRAAMPEPGGGGVRRQLRNAGWRGLRWALAASWRWQPEEMIYSSAWRYPRFVKVADGTLVVATSFITALPAKLIAGEKAYYFAQHFEPLFKNESRDPPLAEEQARLSYHLGLNLIANSTWLRRQMEAELPGRRIEWCPNAIDLSVFCGRPKSRDRASRRCVIISYGGRNAEWKGFADIARAVRIARDRRPGVELVWRVFGSAILPPSNTIAPYEALGFLTGKDLAAAYASSDVLLSASWYESFPLFPLEAMACGVPVVTTQAGTEEFATADVTAEIVAPRSPESIAGGLLRLIDEPEYAHRIATAGQAKSREFTWQRATDRMEAILCNAGGENLAGSRVISGAALG